MRFVIPAAAFALLATPVLAQAPQTAPATTPPAATAPATAPTSPAPTSPAPTTAAPAAKPAQHHMTFAERFKAANTTNDGHLTLEQAKAAKWTYVVKHFTAMDTAKKGYVTADEIHAYGHASHAASHSSSTKPKTTAPAAAPSTDG